MSNESEVMAEIGRVQNVVAVIVRNNVNRDDKKIDIDLAVEGVNKVTDASPSSKSNIEMDDAFKLDVGAVVDKVLVKKRCSSELRLEQSGRGRCK